MLINEQIRRDFRPASIMAGAAGTDTALSDEKQCLSFFFCGMLSSSFLLMCRSQ
jgi:hypothetical protein